MDLRLRTVRDSDLEAFYRFEHEPDSAAQVRLAPREWDAHVHHWRETVLANADNLARTIVFDERIVGYVSSWPTDEGRFLGYWIGREFFGRGVATEAVRQFLTVDDTKLLQAIVRCDNIASWRLLERLDFQRREEFAEGDERLYRYELQR